MKDVNSTHTPDRAALIARLREHGAGLCEEAADMLEADAVPQEPVAYAIFAENWNIRIWSTEQQHVKRIAQEQGLSLVKLYTAPQRQPAVPQEPVAWYEYNADLDAWFLAYGHNPKAKTRPLVFGDAAPQQRPRLTDAEILNIHALPCWVRTQFADKGYGIALDTTTVVDFARAVEKKVRGEA